MSGLVQRVVEYTRLEGVEEEHTEFGTQIVLLEYKHFKTFGQTVLCQVLTCRWTFKLKVVQLHIYFVHNAKYLSSLREANIAIFRDNG
jgi:hypothetical protein